MPADIATYILAARAGVKLHKYLDADELARVADFDQRLGAREGASSDASAPRIVRRSQKRSAPAEIRVDGRRVPTGALGGRLIDEAKRMSEVYPIFYALENSMRQYIDGHLTLVYGEKWHEDTKLVGTKVRAVVERNRGAAARTRYHGRRNARFIYYTDLGHLPLIVHSENGWKVFEPLLPSDRWLHGIVDPVEASRNVVAHMNPLSKRDVDRIRLNFADWLDQIKDTEPPIVAP